MALKTKYDNEADIPEAFKELYTEKDGKWLLTGVEGLKTQDDIDKLSAALTKERKDHKDTKEKFKTFEGVDPEKYKEEQEEIVELRAVAAAGTGKMDKEAVDKLVESKIKLKLAPVEKERDDLKAALGESTGTVAELTGKIKRSKIETEVRKVAEQMKVVPTAVDDIVIFAERHLEVQDDDTIVTREIGSNVGGLTPKDWLEQQKETRPHWWPASQGGGGKGGKDIETFANNPWSTEHFNLTEQGKMVKADPKKAEQMKARATAQKQKTA